MNGADDRQHLGVCQALSAKNSAALPGVTTSHAGFKYCAHFCQRIGFAVGGNLCILHRTSFAKYAAAFYDVILPFKSGHFLDFP